MKKSRLILLTVCVALLAGIVTFASVRAALARELGNRCVGCRAATLCLELNPRQTDQICAADCQFTEEAFELNRILAADRESLAVCLEDPSVSDSRVMGQVERVIFSHDALTNRVIKHILAVRPHLSIEQQKKLMKLCVDSLNGRWCYKAESIKAGHDANVPGIGAVLKQVRAADPSFAQEFGDLQKRLQAQRNRLTLLLNDAASTDEQIVAQSRALADAHNAMERRMAAYVLKVRSGLNSDQQKTLMLMLTRGIREQSCQTRD